MPASDPRLDFPPTRDLADTAVAAANFSVFCNALKAAKMVDSLRGAAPLTLFAPTDAAFRKITRETINALLKDRERLRGILNLHLVRGRLMASDLRSGPVVTLQGESLAMLVDVDGMRISNARLTRTDIEASNGVIHGIDTVLMPT